MVGPNNHGEFSKKVGVKETRKMQARRERQDSAWFGLGMMGIVGWSVAIPTLVGIALGLWLDSKWPGRISWTLIMLFLGLFAGCLNAYYWVKRQLASNRGRKQNE